MSAQVTLWRTTGVNQEFISVPPATVPPATDTDRGLLLQLAVDAAKPGDEVVVGPGNYLKPHPNPITKDGVRLHLLPGARIYDIERGDITHQDKNLPVIDVTSGNHWLSGHGTIEHQGQYTGAGGSFASGVYVKATGTLICEADEIISTFTLNSAVKIAGNLAPSPAALLYLNTRKQLAINYDALEVGLGSCHARVQHAESKGDSDANAVETNTAEPRNARVVNIQRAESVSGYTLNLQGFAATCNLSVQSVLASAATAIFCNVSGSYADVGQVSSTSSGHPTIVLSQGRVFADEVEQGGAASAIHVSFKTHFAAHLVLNNQVSQTGINQNGIKVISSFLTFEAIIDVAEIKLQSTAVNSVFADAANMKIAMIRNFLSAKPISANSPPIPNNH